ncbi:MAG: response regulator [Aliihoeflea sp.]
MNQLRADMVGAAQIRILLLEDSHIDAELIQNQLGKIGMPVDIVGATRKREFEAALAAGDFDLIIADYSLPDFDGMAALKMAEKNFPTVPFIFVSGVAGEHFATEAVRAGATDYVTKKDLDKIPMVVRRALDEAREKRERARAVNALAESENRFRNLADSAPALIWSTDANGKLTFANRKFEAEYGGAADMLGEGWRSIVHADDVARFDAAFRAAFDNREPFNAEIRTLKDGEVRWLRCEAIPRRDGSGAFVGFSGCAVDVTDSKLAREMLEAEVAQRTAQLRDSEEALRQSQKMEAIGQLTGGIAHDFNNMLAGILGSAELLQRRLSAGRSDGIERYLEGIITSAGRAASLTQRMLAFSRRQSLDIKATNLNELVLSLEDMLRRTLNESIQLDLDLARDTCPALTDANQLESAILNLAINARDAMPEGGVLTISTRNRHVDGDFAQRKGLAAGDYVALTVTDTGTGMSKQVQEKAFDPFFTTKPIGQGTGLGLSMVFGFAKQLGGAAQILSQEGKGTTIEIIMPCDPDAEFAALDSSRDGAVSPDEVTQTVLVVEDEAIVQMLVVDALNEMGFETLEAHDAPSALKIVESGRRIDLMVSDVGLPGMDGRELADHVRRHLPELPILFATGYAEGARTRAGFLGERMDLISKPFDMAEFERKVRAIIGRD